MHRYFADSVKQEARAMHKQVKTQGCESCPLKNQKGTSACDGNRFKCYLYLLHYYQNLYDYRVDLQQNLGFY